MQHDPYRALRRVTIWSRINSNSSPKIKTTLYFSPVIQWRGLEQCHYNVVITGCQPSIERLSPSDLYKEWI